MPIIYQFEAESLWQKARIFNDRIYLFTCKRFLKDTHHKMQLELLAGSMMDNIAISLDNASEPPLDLLLESRNLATQLQSCLFRLLDRKYLSAKLFRMLYDLLIEIKVLLTEIIEDQEPASLLGNSLFECN